MAIWFEQMEQFHATNAKNQGSSSSNLFGVFFIKQEKKSRHKTGFLYKRTEFMYNYIWKSQGKRDLIEPLHTLKVDIFAEQL